MVQVSESVARAVLRLLEDVRDANRRAECSDAYFRTHFMTFATLPPISDAAQEIKDALDAAEEPPDPFDDPDE